MFLPSIPRLTEARRRLAASCPIPDLQLKLDLSMIEGLVREGVPSLMLAGLDVTAVLGSEPDISYCVSVRGGGGADEEVVGEISLCC